MNWKAETDEIARRRQLALEQGGADAIARQHGKGKLTIRERIEKLLDPGSFEEVGPTAGAAIHDENGELVGARVFELMCRQRLDAAALVSHHLDLAAFQEGVELARRRVAMKVVFVGAGTHG